MNNSIVFLIETLAPYVDKLKVKNPVIYTCLVLGMYGAWGAANHILTTGQIIEYIITKTIGCCAGNYGDTIGIKQGYCYTGYT